MSSMYLASTKVSLQFSHLINKSSMSSPNLLAQNLTEHGADKARAGWSLIAVRPGGYAAEHWMAWTSLSGRA